MIGTRTQFIDESNRVIEQVDRAAFRNIGHAGATIRKEAIASIIVSEGPSAAGTPPHTRRRQLKRAIRFDYDRKAQNAVIGPRFSLVGESGSAHEFGGEYKGQQFPERSFMGLALKNNIDRFAQEWSGSVGGG